jgi:hypothetical protein
VRFGTTETPLLLSSDTNPVIGNVVDVRSDRRLLELEANLVIPAAAELHWLVLEQRGKFIFEVRFEQVTTTASGSGFFSSGPLDFTLQAGKHYALAVYIETGSDVSAYKTTDPSLPSPSFGRARACIHGSRYGEDGLDATFFNGVIGCQWDMRATTELP